MRVFNGDMYMIDVTNRIIKIPLMNPEDKEIYLGNSSLDRQASILSKVNDTGLVDRKLDTINYDVLSKVNDTGLVNRKLDTINYDVLFKVNDTGLVDSFYFTGLSQFFMDNKDNVTVLLDSSYRRLHKYIYNYNDLITDVCEDGITGANSVCDAIVNIGGYASSGTVSASILNSKTSARNGFFANPVAMTYFKESKNGKYTDTDNLLVVDRGTNIIRWVSPYIKVSTLDTDTEPAVVKDGSVTLVSITSNQTNPASAQGVTEVVAPKQNGTTTVTGKPVTITTTTSTTPVVEVVTRITEKTTTITVAVTRTTVEATETKVEKFNRLTTVVETTTTKITTTEGSMLAYAGPINDESNPLFFKDGSLIQARFYSPTNIKPYVKPGNGATTDSLSYLVVDNGNKCIRSIENPTAQNPFVKTFMGDCNPYPERDKILFNNSPKIFITSDNSIYVIDNGFLGKDKAIKKITTNANGDLLASIFAHGSTTTDKTKTLFDIFYTAATAGVNEVKKEPKYQFTRHDYTDVITGLNPTEIQLEDPKYMTEDVAGNLYLSDGNFILKFEYK